jgi:small-conductance mechanosensitive channel
MEKLRNIELLSIGNFAMDLAQLTTIGIWAAVLVFVYWALEYKLFPWYYGMEAISESNRERMRRVTRFALLSFFAVGVLRLLEIDFALVNQKIGELNMSSEELKQFEMANPDKANDANDIRFIIRISILLEVLVAFVIANLLDLVLGEIVTQRFYRQRLGGQLTNNPGTNWGGNDMTRIKWLRPLLYTLVAILFANLTGLTFYEPFSVPIAFKNSAVSTINVGRILNALLVFFLVCLLFSFIVSFLLKGYYQRRKIDTGSQFAINRLFTYFAYLIGVLLVIQAAGFNLIGVWTGAAALLVGIGIGLQQTFNDLICGIIMLFERSVKVGDVIELSGHEVGTVRKIGARTSVVETRDDIIIFVPNSKLIGENVMNWSQVERKARFHVKVGVAYGSDTELVKEILIKAAKDHNRVLDSPPPFVRFLNFGDSALEFDVLFWSRDLMRVEDTKSDIRLAIDAAFRARDVEVPFPQRDLWIRSKGGKEEGSKEREIQDGENV